MGLAWNRDAAAPPWFGDGKRPLAASKKRRKGRSFSVLAAFGRMTWRSAVSGKNSILCRFAGAGFGLHCYAPDCFKGWKGCWPQRVNEAAGNAPAYFLPFGQDRVRVVLALARQRQGLVCTNMLPALKGSGLLCVKERKFKRRAGSFEKGRIL